MIKGYSFGKMDINGKIYKKDLIIGKDKIYENWRREKGHLLQLKDMETILSLNPDIIIVGQGFFGMMKISKEVIDKLEKSGIEYYFEKSGKAVKLYNRLLKEKPEKNIIASFHLTC
jgi:hypothetical protein